MFIHDFALGASHTMPVPRYIRVISRHIDSILPSDEETFVFKARFIISNRRNALSVPTRVAINTVSRGDVPLHRRVEPGVNVGRTFGDQAELERATRLDPSFNRNFFQERFQLSRRV